MYIIVLMKEASKKWSLGRNRKDQAKDDCAYLCHKSWEGCGQHNHSQEMQIGLTFYFYNKLMLIWILFVKDVRVTEHRDG